MREKCQVSWNQREMPLNVKKKKNVDDFGEEERAKIITGLTLWKEGQHEYRSGVGYKNCTNSAGQMWMMR